MKKNNMCLSTIRMRVVKKKALPDCSHLKHYLRRKTTKLCKEGNGRKTATRKKFSPSQSQKSTIPLWIARKPWYENVICCIATVSVTSFSTFSCPCFLWSLVSGSPPKSPSTGRQQKSWDPNAWASTTNSSCSIKVTNAKAIQKRSKRSLTSCLAKAKNWIFKDSKTKEVVASKTLKSIVTTRAGFYVRKCLISTRGISFTE